MKKNRGSMVIEMTLLMPVFLGCIFLYIMLFVELIHLQQKMEQAAQILYAVEVPEYLAKGTGKTGRNLAEGWTSGFAGDPLRMDETDSGFKGTSSYGDGTDIGFKGNLSYADGTDIGFKGNLSYADGTDSGAAGGLSCLVKSDRREVSFGDRDSWFELQFQMEAGQGNPAKKLRRWQLIADML